MAESDLNDPPQPVYGNKIPDSYLKRFLPSSGQPDDGQDLPYDLKLFLDHIK